MNQQRIPIYLDVTLPNGEKHNPFNESHQYMLVKNLEVKGLSVWKEDDGKIIIKM